MYRHFCFFFFFTFLRYVRDISRILFPLAYRSRERALTGLHQHERKAFFETVSPARGAGLVRGTSDDHRTPNIRLALAPAVCLCHLSRILACPTEIDTTQPGGWGLVFLLLFFFLNTFIHVFVPRKNARKFSRDYVWLGV